MSLRNELSQSAGLLAALDAARNVRAATLLVLAGAVAALASALGGVLLAQVHALLGVPLALAAMGILFYGSTAAGIMLMDEAKGGSSRPMRAALRASLAIGHRLVLVLLVVAAVYLAGLLAMALLLFMCKLPYLGPLLYGLVLPVCIVIAGAAVFGLLAVIVPLAAPAVWSGATAMQALWRLAAIARQRVIGVVLSMLVLLLLTLAVGAIVGGMLGAGTLIAGGLSAAILPTGGLGAAALLGGFGAAGSGYVAAAAVGGGVVGAIAFTPPLLVYLRGCCQVYLANVRAVNVEEVEQQLRASLHAARRKAQDLRARGEPSSAAPVALAAADAAAVPAGCPSCGAACAVDDVFCGSCGQKLK